ncbi:MAG: hypothetical protein ACI9JN_002552 [Bacteroidia bacterium]|jgi:hypothetical protein
MKTLLFLLLSLFVCVIGKAQTTSLVVNFDLRGNRLAGGGPFTMQYTDALDSGWIFKHSFHCPKDFIWSDTISPISPGDVQLTILLDSLKILESYYLVSEYSLNEYDLKIEKQRHPSKYNPFISESFFQGYFRLGSNVSHWSNATAPLESYSMYAGMHEGIMLSKRFGIHFGNGLNYEFSRFKDAPTSQKQRYNYWSLSATTAIRIAPFGYEHKNQVKRNVYLDAGATYYLPLKFRYTSKANNIRVQESGLHDYSDFRIQATITIWRFSLFGNYGLTDFVKQNMYPELPKLQIGVGFTNRL